MKILLVTDFMPPQIHGISVRCKHWVENLRDMGHIVDVCSSKFSNDVQFALDSFNLPFNPDVNVCVGSIDFFKHIINGKYDIVHLVSPSWTDAPNWVYLPSLLSNTPIVVSHHVDIRKYNDEYVKNVLINSFTFTLGECQFFSLPIVCASKICGPTHESLYEFYRLKGEKKLSVFATGVDREQYSPAFRGDQELRNFYVNSFKERGIAPEKIIGYVGRVAKEKNLEVIFKLAERNKKWGFLIVGDGPERKEYQEKYKLDNLIFAGSKRGVELSKHYGVLDLMISPSKTETFGFTILESLSIGTPVLMPEVKVFQEIHTNISEWLVDVSDPKLEIENYENKISSVFLENEGTNFLKAQNHIASFSWRKSAEDLVEIYNDAKKTKINKLHAILFSGVWFLLSLPVNKLLEIIFKAKK